MFIVFTQQPLENEGTYKTSKLFFNSPLAQLCQLLGVNFNPCKISLVLDTVKYFMGGVGRRLILKSADVFECKYFL